MKISELVNQTVKVHEEAEALLNITKRAVIDSRFRLSLADHRHFRDLVDDTELILNEAWRESVKIPAELDYKVANKLTSK